MVHDLRIPKAYNGWEKWQRLLKIKFHHYHETTSSYLAFVYSAQRNAVSFRPGCLYCSYENYNTTGLYLC